jgi:hypothetical protein
MELVGEGLDRLIEQQPEEELFNAIKEGLDYAYRQGQISEALYTASCGRASGSPGQS